MAQPTLYLMLGYPGAGKTTTAEIIEKLTGAERLTSDQVRLEMFPEPKFTPDEHAKLYKELDARTERLLASGKSVIYDANLNRYIHRQEKYAICARTAAKPLLVWVQVSKELAKQRAVDISRNHLVPPGEQPEAMFDRIAGIIEPPRPDENTVVVDGSQVSETDIRQLLSRA